MEETGVERGFLTFFFFSVMFKITLWELAL